MSGASAEEKSAGFVALEKRLENDRVGFSKALEEKQTTVLKKLEALKKNLLDIKSGTWTLEERNQGIQLIDAKIASLRQGLIQFDTIQNAVEKAPESTGAATSDAGPSDVWVPPGKISTIPAGKYLIQTTGYMHLEMRINGQNVLKDIPIDKGTGLFSFAYEVSGPMLIIAKCSSSYAGDRHGFGFVMMDSEGKHVLTTRSGWKSYRPEDFEKWFHGQEIRDLGKVYETGLPSMIDNTLPLIWDAREEAASMCYLVWGL